MAVDLSLLKYTPVPGVPDVEEVEQPTGERCLSPTKAWSESIVDTPKGQALSALYMIMGLMGVPPQVILTIAAVKFADTEKKIDFVDWITNRSNWTAEDKAGAIHVLKTVDVREEQIKAGANISNLFGPLPKVGPEKKSEAAPAAKNPEDDWNLN